MIVASVAIAGAAAVLLSGGGDDGGPEPESSPAVNATTAPLLPTNALQLPDFTFEQLKSLLSQLQGTPVVLNIWGSWCGPCREEGPHLAAAARRYGERVQFLGIDVKDQKDPAREFIRSEGWTYPSLFDPSPRGDIGVELGYFAQPVTIFYGRDGAVVDDFSGPIGTHDLEAAIRKILR